MQNNVISMYRRLLKVAKKVKPDITSKQYRKQIRDTFRQQDTPGSLEELLSKANSSLGYLKMITPRSRGEKTDGHVTRITIGDSSSNSGRKAVTNWHGGNMDPDSVRRHNASLKRAGFQNNYHAKGVF